jgi:hypothetical protein
MEGYLEIRKKGATVFEFDNFKPRYFILNQGVLKFLKKKGQECIGQIHLSISKLEPCPGNPSQFCIDSGSGKYEIRSKKKELVRKWFNAM